MYTDKCPVCGSKDWNYDNTELKGDLLIHQCECDDCDSTWEEVFAFVENRNIVDARISS